LVSVFEECLASFTDKKGAVAEQVQDQDKALRAFETALKHNPNSVLALNAVASIARSRDDFDKAIEYFQRILNIKQDNGEVWGSMGELSALSMSLVVLTKLRTLSVDEGRSAQSIYRLPASALPSPKPKGKYFKSPLLIADNPARAKAVVWNRYTLRPIWIIRACGRGILKCPPNGAQ